MGPSRWKKTETCSKNRVSGQWKRKFNVIQQGGGGKNLVYTVPAFFFCPRAGDIPCPSWASAGPPKFSGALGSGPAAPHRLPNDRAVNVWGGGNGSRGLGDNPILIFQFFAIGRGGWRASIL